MINYKLKYLKYAKKFFNHLSNVQGDISSEEQINSMSITSFKTT